MTDTNQASERRLLPEEIDLIRALLTAAGSEGERYINGLPSCLVRDLNDGGMRSIRFIRSNKPFKRSLKSARYLDTDGVLVLIDLYVDDALELHEVDIWKVDFSPLHRYPSPNNLDFTD